MILREMREKEEKSQQWPFQSGANFNIYTASRTECAKRMLGKREEMFGGRGGGNQKKPLRRNHVHKPSCERIITFQESQSTAVSPDPAANRFDRLVLPANDGMRNT